MQDIFIEDMGSGTPLVLVHGFLERYFNSWLFAFPVALFAAFIMGPVAKSIANKIASKD